MGWKIEFRYSDGGMIKVSTRKKGGINLEMAKHYYTEYGQQSDGGFYTESPYTKHKPVHLTKVIAGLEAMGNE